MWVLTCRSCDIFLQPLQRHSRCLPGKPYNSWGQSDWMRLIWAWITDASWAFRSFCKCWPGRGTDPGLWEGRSSTGPKRNRRQGINQQRWLDRAACLLNKQSSWREMYSDAHKRTDGGVRCVWPCDSASHQCCVTCLLLKISVNPTNVLPFLGLYMISDEPPITKLAHHFFATADSRPVFLPRLVINYLVRVHFLPPLVQLQRHAANIQICCHNTFVSCKLI